VIVGDDSSTDQTRRIEEIVENLIVVRSQVNLRFLRNCNNAAAVARGTFLVFLNNDTNVQKDWLRPMVELMEMDPRIGIVGSKLVYPDGRLQEAGGIVWNDASGWNFGRLNDAELPEYNYVKDVDYVSGASLMIRRSLWNDLGGFDERFVPAYFEDSDLAFQARRSGYRVVYQPRSVVVHFEGVSNGTSLSGGQKLYQVSNQRKFQEKWQNVLAADHFSNGEHVFLARDRTRTKRTVLVVDHYVPTFDMDAGGRTSDAFIRILLSLGMHVVFVGDNFNRSEPYTTRLQQLGVEVLYGSGVRSSFREWFAERAGYFEAVLLQRPHIAIKYIDFFRAFPSLTVLYYGHDLAFHRLEQQFSVDQLESTRTERNRMLCIETELLQKADVVLSCSESESRLMQAIGVRGKVVFVPPYFFSPFTAVFPFLERSGLLFVGGFGHAPNVDGVLWFCDSVLPLIEKVIPEIVINIVGSRAPESIRELGKRPTVRICGYTSDEELISLYMNSRLAVVPLRYGGGVKGKTIEAMHFGIPTVGTKFAYEGISVLEQSESSFDSPEEFATEVIDLYNEFEKWEKVRLRQKAFVDRFFSWERGKDLFSQLLRN
jgi:GT2 family glycosyltransferase